MGEAIGAIVLAWTMACLTVVAMALVADWLERR